MRRRTFLFSPLIFAGGALANTRPAIETRLFGGALRGGVWQAGLEIDIGAEWKTYWRNPGDAGIPPSFDWTGSRNLKSAEVFFPAPRRFHDAAGETLGYKGYVGLPILVTPEDAGLPVHLKLHLFFAVCNDICIPAEATAELPLSRDDTTGASRIDEMIGVLPETRAFIASAHLEAKDGKPVLVLRWLPDAPPPSDLFVEGAEPAYPHAPVFEDGRAIIRLAGLRDPGDLKGKTLRFTLTSNSGSLEQSAVIE